MFHTFLHTCAQSKQPLKQQVLSVEQRSHLLSHFPPHFPRTCVQDGGSLTQKTLTPEYQSHLAVQGLNTERVVVVKRKWLREFIAEIKVRGGGWSNKRGQCV